MKKLKLKSLFKSGDKVIVGVDKSQSFFTLFPKFLINCKLTKNEFVEDYQFYDPVIESMTDSVYFLSNAEHDLTLIFGTKAIFIQIISNDLKYMESMLLGLSKIINFGAKNK